MSHTGKNSEDIRKSLIDGYKMMSEINLEEADLSLKSDSDSLRICEEKLTECE